MGDRANVKVIQTPESTPLFLYTHWDGYVWNQQLAHALLFGESRWNDPPYLTRILISRMYQGIADKRVGGGVSVGYLLDNEYPVLVLDIENQVVYIEGTEDRESFESYAKREHPEMEYGHETKSIFEV